MPLFAVAVDHLTTLDVTLYAGGFMQALDAIAKHLQLLHLLEIAFARVHSGGTSSGSSGDAFLPASTDGAATDTALVVRARDIAPLSRLSRLRLLQLTRARTPAAALVRVEGQVTMDGFNDGEFSSLVSGLP
jgi:hypothetical protein